MEVSSRPPLYLVLLVLALAAAQQPQPITGTSDHAVSPPLKDLKQAPMISSHQLSVERLDHPEVRYRVSQQVGEIHICGPRLVPADYYKQEAATFPEIQKDAETLGLIIRHLGFAGNADLSDQQKISVYHEYLRLRSITLEPSGGGYKFHVRTTDSAHRIKRTALFIVDGLIDGHGQVSILNRQPVFYNPCPICLAVGTRIDTPNGPIAIQDLKPGMLVWTINARKEKTAVPILKTAAVPVGAEHQMVDLALKDGRELWASQEHPTADGSSVGQLEEHAAYDGSTIMSAKVRPYGGAHTYDLLPAGDTGFYWANGILLASTLREPGTH